MAKKVIPAQYPDATSLLNSIRKVGWRVAIHNDYHLRGWDMTFYLLTNPDTGRFVKGEGRSDAAALIQVAEQVWPGRPVTVGD